MAKKKKVPKFYENLEISAAGSEGKCVSRVDGKVLLIEFAVPGDIANVKTTYHKHSYEEGHITELITPSPDRVQPFCEHHGICGGCKWQQMSYPAQLRYKQQQVTDAFQRIGKFPFPAVEPILGSAKTTHYRNKLEYSFTDKKWFSEADKDNQGTEENKAGLGYHIPGRFDKVFDVYNCYLQPDLQNKIRNEIRDFCLKNDYSFINLYSQEGLMRTMILRNNDAGEWMLILCFTNEDVDKRVALLEHLKAKFPEISSLMYVINTKRNDTINDLEVHCYHGKDHLIEKLDTLSFRIGPTSFFQINTQQTVVLYEKALEFAGLTGNELVYDLYTGVGTIALFLAKKAAHVVGIEYVPEAIEDAWLNAKLNDLDNLTFYAGDMKDILSDELIQKHGRPDVVLTDPPRSGMHGDVIAKLLEIGAAKVVYVSCNPATQARDIALMTSMYEVTKVQPVDMFPHTHHVENIVLLELKANESGPVI